MSSRTDTSRVDSDCATRGRGDRPQDRMVRSAAALIARDGLAATGMREVADHAHAPRGSIGHYFPGGKNQMTMEALAWMGATVYNELDHAGPKKDQPLAGGVAVLARFVAMWRRGLVETQLTTGCSVAAVVHDSDNPKLLARAAEVFTSWRRPFYDALLVDGFGKQRAHALATTVIAALEGAVILSRAERCITPLEETAAVLHDLLAVRQATQAKARDDSRGHHT